MANSIQPKKNAERVDSIPNELSILPLRNTIAFPFSVLPLAVGIPRSVKLVEEALEGDRLIGLLAVKDSSIEEPQPGQIYEIGTVAKVHQVHRMPGKGLQVIVEGIERFRVKHWVGTESYLRAEITLAPDVVEQGLELDALQRSLRDLAQEVVALSPSLPDEAGTLLNQVQDPRYLTYLVAANVRLQIADGQKILEMDHLKDKLRALISHLTHEKEVLTLGQKIQTEAREEMDKAQREYYLRQQLKAIQKELGERDESQSAFTEYADKIEKTDLPEEAKKEAERELKRLEGMSPQAAEYSVINTYLDWLLELPWNVSSEDQLDINNARAVLDEDHYDLQEVKDRIVEYLGVRKLVKERGIETLTGEEATASEAMGAILCFTGPPGVGKTSLGQSIARALGRKFTRMSLGGMRDEAEIRGHRRTYIGAMPGRIIQAIKRAGTRNPIFMLDEVDKIGNDWRGDPSSALLEVLDPAQNHTFRDHYLDVDFDLSDVIFITTANQLETIPPPLRDRMEIIQLDGYTEYEKIHIAQSFLVPRQVKANGLREEEISFTEEALNKIVQDYTREAGVRNLERQIGAICRKSAVRIAAKELTHVEITPEIVREYLKKEKFESESPESIEIPGIATGLSVTSVGGDILFVEATSMKGKGELTLTGQLGDVMRESAQIAHSYVRSKSNRLGVDPRLFEKTDVHLHVPAGAIPKDGPSAGVTILMAMASLFSGRPVRSDIGMTGEVTLRGRMLPVGGIKMKVLAAHRAGLKTVILPKRNERDLDELPDDVRNTMKFVPVEGIDEALEVALLPVERKTEVPEALSDQTLLRQPKVSLN
ncbi:MAG: endopeptidase La [Deltaproteobacteria bacterium]|nr:MAG: endopeptidase La [Deltaproteobacteria bacterium]